ncbi:NUDIX domain-containing protein [Helicobacter saguini]|uniref:NUDIX domain-containing protein n=1 Tax=Helicobacter saguini TaxID=1548018 RepID=UPI000A765B28|nr:NUDIX hydrolase [Helicobacter saguini]
MDNMIFYRGSAFPLQTPQTPKILSNEPLLEASKYIQLRQVKFEENGAIKTWDIAKSHDSVAILLYDFKMKGFIFVRQFRVSVYLKNAADGYMYELCAGLCDKEGKSVTEIALEELQEECGYFIESNRLESVGEFYSSVGMNGAKLSLFYAAICDDDRKGKGGGNASENENIETIFVPNSLIFEFLKDKKCPKSQSLCYAVMWYEMNKK